LKSRAEHVSVAKQLINARLNLLRSGDSLGISKKKVRVIHGAEFCVDQFVDRPARLRVIAVPDSFVETSGVPATRQGNTNGI
jgi:hypothetical protein